MRFILLSFLLLSFQSLKAQEKGQGYYITLNNDTVFTTYKIKTTPGYFTPGDNIYEELPIQNQDKKKIKLKPTEIKGFYIELENKRAHFISMPIRNNKQKFLRVVLLSPELNIYEYSVPTGNRIAMQFVLYRPEKDTLYVRPDDGNQKTKRRLKEYFAGLDDILSIFSSMKDLFTRPGLVQDDMIELIERILKEYKE